VFAWYRRHRRITALTQGVASCQRSAAAAIRDGDLELAHAWEVAAAQYGRLLDIEHGNTPKVYRPR
jgi:Tfp pilus assembly protein PilX